MSASNPGLYYGYVPTAGEWNSYFAGKQDWSPILDGIVSAGGTPSVVPQTIWTPFDASGASLALTINSVAYTQIASMVYVMGSITYPTTSNFAQATIGGLPVTCANQGYAVSASPTVNNTLTAFNAITVQGQSYFVFAAGSGSPITNANLSGKTVQFNICYPAV